MRVTKSILFLLAVLICLPLVTGCGGGDGNNMGDGDNNGPGPGIQTRVVTGTVNQGTAKNISPRTYKAKLLASYIFDSISPSSVLAAGQAGTFLVRAVSRDGSILSNARTNLLRLLHLLFSLGSVHRRKRVEDRG